MSFEVTNFEDVLREAAGEAGQDADNIGQPEWLAWRRFANRRLDAAWRYHFWPFLRRCELRFYRLAYDAGQIYAAQAEVYWPLTGQYFTALQVVLPGANPTDSSGNINLNYWALTAQYAIQPDPLLDNLGQPGQNLLPFDLTVTYAQGQRVAYIGNVYQFYGLPQMVLANAAGNGTYSYVGLVNGRPSYQVASNQSIYWDSRRWVVTYPSNFPGGFASDSNVATPDLAKGWYSLGDDSANSLTITAQTSLSVTGILPTDSLCWGVVNAFDSYVAYEQTGFTPFTIVEGAFSSNPATTTRGNELNWWLSENGVQVATQISYAWIQFRLRSPILNGNLFRADTVYQAGTQIYYSSATAPGNFYTANNATNAGDTPESVPASWSVVALPRMFHRYLVLGMAADWERFEGEDEPNGLQTAMSLDALAQNELDDIKTLYVGQMGQRIKTQVQTR